MRIFLFTFLLVMFFLPSKARACDLNQLDFGSSIKQVSNKFDLPDEPETQDVIFIDLRANNICEEIDSGRAKLTFYKNKLARVYIENYSMEFDLYDLVKKNLGELNVTPNFAEIRGENFVGFVEKEKLLAHYSFKKLEGRKFESVNISDKELLTKLSEFEAKQEN